MLCFQSGDAALALGKMAELSLTDVLPNMPSGLDGTGFIFGAGTSFAAGYPLMSTLTRQVVGALTAPEKAALDEALNAYNQQYDTKNAQPNIESMADLVVAHAIRSMDARFSALEARFRELITDAILSVAMPKLDAHVRFFELLKARTFGRACCIHVFTTNYDVTFELAGAYCGVTVETGFGGAIERFFDPARFGSTCGEEQPGGRFAAHPQLVVRLIKLHGSISWVMRDSKLYEMHPFAIPRDEPRVMVLPRRGKVLETLQHPYDTLFTVASRVLGAECKYLASCGFSFSDDHINKTLLIPNLTAAKLRLFALSQLESEGMSQLKASPSFGAGLETSRISRGSALPDGTTFWRFDQFVELFR